MLNFEREVFIAMRKTLSILLSVVLVFSVMAGAEASFAKKAPAISAKVLHMKKGQSHKIKMTNAKKVKWSTSSKKIATVKKGKVTAKKAGTATITAKVGKKKYKCTVTVSNGKKKAVVIYFSATGNTKKAAVKVKKATGADIVRIVPKKAYSKADLTYEKTCRANDEQNKNSKPAIATVIKNLKQYKVVYLGYPIWWGKEPGTIRTFMTKYSLKGKTVMPFCTSGGSGIDGSIPFIKKNAKGATIGEGMDLTDATTAEIKEWIK